MKQSLGNIQQLIPRQDGVCSICELPALLVAKDTVTPLKAGLCCLDALTFTDHMLTVHVGKTGIKHPPAFLH